MRHVASRATVMIKRVTNQVTNMELLTGNGPM
jgi:hypothetical protein